MYKCIVFDMDGTLVNSYEGIFNAYQWVSERMGVEFGGAATVYQAIGSPLPYAFQQFWDMNPAQIPRAVAYYRDYYARKGKDQAVGVAVHAIFIPPEAKPDPVEEDRKSVV